MERLDRQTERLVTTALNLAELQHGAAGSDRRPAMLKEIADLANRFVVLPVDAEVAVLFGELDYRLARRGRPLPFMDLLISAVLLRHGESRIVTDNPRHFRGVPGLSVDQY